MNILFMNSARTWGGTEKWVKMASEAIGQMHGHRTFLVYRKDDIGQKFSIPKFRLPCLAHIDPFTFFGLVRLIHKEKIDIIIPTKRKDYLTAGLAARFCGITNILRLGIERRLRIPGAHRLIFRTFADGIIVNAEKIRQTLLRSSFLIAENIKVVYNGIDTGTIDRHAKKPETKQFPFLVVSAGILTERKGFDFLIRGFARFARDHSSCNPGLIIMGDGPKRNDLRKLAEELGIGDRTLFPGFEDNPWRYMAIGDVIAMTSRNEGISNALLEGMYLGAVPVSTYAGGSEELVEEGRNGFLVEYGDTARLSGIFRELADNTDLRNGMALAAKETVKNCFSIDTMNREIIDFCRSIMEMTERH
jgi:glycosyltransferase involved in cell wall biosynthesis